jgi:hypothetical protein
VGFCLTQGVIVMQSGGGQFPAFLLRRLIPKETRRSLRSSSFVTGLLVVFLMLIVTVGIVLLSPWLESLTLLGQ